MADELRHSIVDSILAWIRSGIAAGMTVIAGFFTYFAWYYKEVLIPSTAPVNVTTELIVKEAGSKSTTSKSNEELQAIELAITAKNPSTRTVYLLPNCWFASGIKIWPKSASEDTWVELSGYANLRVGPSDTARTLRILEKGANLRAVDGHESWLRVVDPETSETGWIYEALAAVAAPTGTTAQALKSTTKSRPTRASITPWTRLPRWPLASPFTIQFCTRANRSPLRTCFTCLKANTICCIYTWSCPRRRLKIL